MLKVQQSVIILMGAALASFIIVFLQKNAEEEVERSMVQAARTYSDTFTGIRNFYQEIVVNRVRGTEVYVTHDFRDHAHSVPIPATMIIELAEYLNGSEIDVTFALVSDYPFPWRAERHLLEFDVQALAALRQTGNDEYYRFDEEAGRTYLHYARPVVMETGCVDCHNNHPDSPRTDWEVGDVRAIQLFEIPVDETTAENQMTFAWLLGAIIFTSVTAIFSLLLFNWRSEQARQLLRAEAHFDTLTGAMRRQRFQEIYERQQRNGLFLLAIADIDDFKAVNTTLGHAAGDVVLREVAQGIRSAFPNAEVICRYGGEEFLILVERSKIDGSPSDYFDQAVKSLSQVAISIQDNMVPVTISVGYAKLAPDANLNFVATEADFALRHAKRLGKNRAVFASSDLLCSLGFTSQQYTMTDLDAALRKGEIRYFFQPIYDVTAQKIAAFEALVRWRREDGFAPPPAFLPQYLASLRKPENAPHVIKAIQTSIAETPWPVADVARISFNFDPYDLFNDPCKNSLVTALVDLKAQGYHVSLEITETSYLADRSSDEFSEKIHAIADLGFPVHMDDFGKEGASIERLAAFDFATIKTDRSLIAGLLTSDRKKFALRFLLEFASANGANVVVEGVETVEERDFLRSLGVRYMQGFLFGRPE
jgi:diguanylate cyclase (GGDEF)-like protein